MEPKYQPAFPRWYRWCLLYAVIPFTLFPLAIVLSDIDFHALLAGQSTAHFSPKHPYHQAVILFLRFVDFEIIAVLLASIFALVISLKLANGRLANSRLLRHQIPELLLSALTLFYPTISLFACARIASIQNLSLSGYVSGSQAVPLVLILGLAVITYLSFPGASRSLLVVLAFIASCLFTLNSFHFWIDAHRTARIAALVSICPLIAILPLGLVLARRRRKALAAVGTVPDEGQP